MAKAVKIKEGDRAERFCQEYIVDLHVTNAAIRAGYAEKSAHVQGSRLLKKDKVRARIEELMKERSKRTLVDSDFVVRNLVEITHRCKQAQPVLVFDPVEKQMVQKTEMDEKGNIINLYEFDSNGANRALELLGRHLGMFTDRVICKAIIEQPLFGPKQ